MICSEIYTSGTTGPPFISIRGDREQRYVGEFFSLVGEIPPGQPLQRALQFNNPYHGALTPIPVPMHFHQIGIYDRGSFEHARRVLTTSHRDRDVEPDCTLMIGLERVLRAFTHATAETIAPRIRTRLQAIISFSQYLTPAWRQRHEALWGCPVVDRFSLSEVFGGASQSPRCGWWHFDPVVVAEVVGHRSRKPIREGHGMLVLTALFPFQEAQPLVRYLTGDLVEVTHSRSSRPGQLAFRPLGRAHAGVPLPGGDDWLLTPATVFEVVDELADVARLPRFQDAADVIDPVAIGHPRYSIEWRERGSLLEVCLNLQPRAGLGRRAERTLLRQAEERLLAAAPQLAEAARLMVRAEPVLTPHLIAHAD